MKSLAEATGPVQQINIIRHILAEDTTFPNNGLLPLLIYRNALRFPDNEQRAKVVAEIFESNGWVNSWEDGIFRYHHYHSTAHEVLGIIGGSGRVQFGGPNGISLLLEEGDVVIIPAGVAHKHISDDADLVCVGAYPTGQEYDIRTGEEGEKPDAIHRIKRLPLPEADPLYGVNGPLIKNWINEPDKIEDIPE